jgi:hypothetical protein
MFQAALDSESSDPSHDDFRITLDNAGERRIAPNTFLVMTGNSPREDSGRVVQSRPFKRRHNLLPVENVFRRVLNKTSEDFSKTLFALWEQVGTALRVEPVDRAEFSIGLMATHNADSIGAVQNILRVLDRHSVGISFGLVKKILKTAGMRFALTGNFQSSLDFGMTEAVFPLLSAEEVIDGKSLKDSLEEVAPSIKSPYPVFFAMADQLLRAPDTLGRLRPFL